MIKARSTNINMTIYTVLLLVCVLGFWLFENFYTPATYSEGIAIGEKTEIPDYLLPSSTTDNLVVHEHFMLSYNEHFEQAENVKQTELDTAAELAELDTATEKRNVQNVKNFYEQICTILHFVIGF